MELTGPYNGDNPHVIPAAKIEESLLSFSEHDYNAAQGIVKDLMYLWKQHQSPGKVLDASLKSYQLSVVGRTVARRIWGPLLSLVLARARAGLALPPVPAA